MPADISEFAVVGLGKIGGNLALQALRRGYRVVGSDVDDAPPELAQAGLDFAPQLENLRERLTSPRVIFLYVPAGAVVDSVLAQLCEILEPDDLVVDGGNSYWGDSLERHERMQELRLRYVDLGTSGGPSGARTGACFMAGGVRESIERIEPILKDLAVENGYVHAGPPGAGHFTKLVHNGIEFGMLQAIGEGVDLLEHYRDDLPIEDILKAWGHGSVIRSWLVELMEQQYRAHGGLADVPGYIEDTGEVNWLVDDAMELGVPMPVISQSVIQLVASRDQQRNAARSVALMRHGFGEHPLGPDERFARNRHTSRIGPFRRKE